MIARAAVDLGDVRVRDPDHPHQAVVEQRAQRPHRLLPRRRRVGPVELVQPDRVDVQPAQRGLARPPQVGRRAVESPRRALPGVPALGRHEDVGPAVRAQRVRHERPRCARTRPRRRSRRRRCRSGSPRRRGRRAPSPRRPWVTGGAPSWREASRRGRWPRPSPGRRCRSRCFAVARVLSCPAGSFATVTSLFDDPRGDRGARGRPGRAARRPDAAAGARRGRRPAAPAR